MLGYIISYNSYDNKSRTTFHHLLFGRILYKNYRNKRYGYYIPGMLDNTPFYKLLKSRIFVLDKSTIDVEKLNAYGEVSIRETQRDINEANMITGEKYWRLKIEERGLLFKKRRREKKNEF